MRIRIFFFFAIVLSTTLLNCKKGDDGTNGQTALIKTSAEPAGANCSSGGTKIESGLDANGNGTLESTEVIDSQTRYICNGNNGANSLIKTTPEAAGGNCGTGGVKVETGTDANKNGLLEAAEVTTTQYLCNGAVGKNSLIRTSVEGPGANCKYGGIKLETGLDTNADGLLGDDEVTATQARYVCNGAGTIYSDWMDADVEAIDPGMPDEIMYSGKKNINVAALTPEMIEQCIVLMYYKNSQNTIYPVDRDDVSLIVEVDGRGWFGVNAGFTFGRNNIKFLAYAYDNDRLNGVEAKIRYVIVPGMIAGRTVKDLRKMSYEEVAKLYNIK